MSGAFRFLRFARSDVIYLETDRSIGRPEVNATDRLKSYGDVSGVTSALVKIPAEKITFLFLLFTIFSRMVVT